MRKKLLINTLVEQIAPHQSYPGWFAIYYSCGHATIQDLVLSLGHATCQQCLSIRGGDRRDN